MFRGVVRVLLSIEIVNLGSVLMLLETEVRRLAEGRVFGGVGEGVRYELGRREMVRFEEGGPTTDDDVAEDATEAADDKAASREAEEVVDIVKICGYW